MRVSDQLLTHLKAPRPGRQLEWVAVNTINLVYNEPTAAISCVDHTQGQHLWLGGDNTLLKTSFLIRERADNNFLEFGRFEGNQPVSLTHRYNF